MPDGGTLSPKRHAGRFEMGPGQGRPDLGDPARGQDLHQTLEGGLGSTLLNRAMKRVLSQGRGLHTIEGLMNQFEGVMWTWGLKVPAGDATCPWRAPTASSASSWSRRRRQKPYRVRAGRRASSPWPPCQDDRRKLVADIIATFGSVNMIAGELDR